MEVRNFSQTGHGARVDLVPQLCDRDSISMSMKLTEAIAQANGMFSAAVLSGAADVTGTFLALQRYAGTGQLP